MAVQEADLRRSLVLAAESVMNEAFSRLAQGDNSWKAEKSQLNQLIGVCGEALCAEEIENYLRYQASRERPSWGLNLVNETITKFNAATSTESEIQDRIQAWRHFSVYLARAFTYQNKSRGTSGRRDGRPR